MSPSARKYFLIIEYLYSKVYLINVGNLLIQKTCIQPPLFYIKIWRDIKEQNRHAFCSTGLKFSFSMTYFKLFAFCDLKGICSKLEMKICFVNLYLHTGNMLNSAYGTPECGNVPSTWLTFTPFGWKTCLLWFPVGLQT